MTVSYTKLRSDVDVFHFEHKCSTNQIRVLQEAPQILLGKYKLFQFDQSTNCLYLSSKFRDLLNISVKHKLLNSSVFTAKSLNEICQIFQNRVVPKDLPKEKFHELFKDLGFMTEDPFPKDITPNKFCILPADWWEVEKRMNEIVAFIDSSPHTQKGRMSFLGSGRKLSLKETQFLQNKVNEMVDNDIKCKCQDLLKKEDITDLHGAYILTATIKKPKAATTSFRWESKDSPHVLTEKSDKEEETLLLGTSPDGTLRSCYFDITLFSPEPTNFKELMSRIDDITKRNIHYVTRNRKKPPSIATCLNEIQNTLLRINKFIECCNTLTSS